VPDAKTLSVTQLLRRIKNVVEIEVGEVWVEGEVSNLKKQASGHWYFTLKDEGAQIQCAMFGARKRNGHECLNDGAKVRVFAETSIYEARGSLQIIVMRAESAGQGDLQAQFEALKRKLHAEGLFDAARKKALPRFPKNIGIVTSETGAVIQDIQQVIARRAPWVKLFLLPVRVQGKGAEREIAAAIHAFAHHAKFGLPACDLLIVGRGGGSLEDLWCFNEEIVARAIARCEIPVISAVGHEIDFTICDFVADLRAPTPSAAAEVAVPDAAELKRRMEIIERRMQQQVHRRMEQWQYQLDAMRRGSLQRRGERILREPVMRLDSLRDRLSRAIESQLLHAHQRLEKLRIAHRSLHPRLILERRAALHTELGRRLQQAMRQIIDRREKQLKHLDAILRTLGPDSSLQRGYSITFDAHGRILRSADDANVGETITTRLAHGTIESTVTTMAQQSRSSVS
jgi:exodeoxyribonuclease VII large subunit